MLGLYQERIGLDLHIYRGRIGANFTADIMKKRVLGVKARKLTQKMKDGLVKAKIKAAKKNVASLDPENFSALECVDLFYREWCWTCPQPADMRAIYTADRTGKAQSSINSKIFR
jgi:hypothetical protein